MPRAAVRLLHAGHDHADLQPAEREPRPDREGLEGNLCRCTGYHNIVKAVQQAAKTGSGASSKSTDAGGSAAADGSPAETAEAEQTVGATA